MLEGFPEFKSPEYTKKLRIIACHCVKRPSATHTSKTRECPFHDSVGRQLSDFSEGRNLFPLSIMAADYPVI